MCGSVFLGHTAIIFHLVDKELSGMLAINGFPEYTQCKIMETFSNHKPLYKAHLKIHSKAFTSKAKAGTGKRE